MILDEHQTEDKRAAFWRKSVSFIYQDYGMIDNEMFHSMCRSESSKQSAAGQRGLENRVGLCGIEKDRAMVLSGGKKQRLGVARAIYKNTSVIISFLFKICYPNVSTVETGQMFAHLIRKRLKRLVW